MLKCSSTEIQAYGGKLMKKILFFVCSLLLVFSTSSNVFATATDPNAELSTDAGALFSVDAISGCSGDDLTSLFDETSARAVDGSPQLTDVEISEANGQLVFDAILKYADIDMRLSSSGDIYKNEKTSNSGTYDDLILAEMADIDGIHFVQFRVDKNKPEIFIVLQLTQSKELLSFNIPIEPDVFNNMYDIADNPLSGKDLEEKIAALYSVSHNLIDAESSTTKYHWSSPVCTTQGSPIPKGTFNGWADLFKDLKDGSAKLSDHPNVEADLFKGTGWQDDNAWNIPYMVMSYSKPNGPGQYLTQFTLLDIITQDHRLNNDTYKLALQLQYSSGALVKYDEYTDMLTVLYFDFGLSFDHVSVGIGDLTDNAFFINRIVSRKYLEEGNLVKAFITLYPPADSAVSVLEGLSDETNQPATEIRYFPDTLSAQLAKHNGKIIKGIVATSATDRLTLPGHLINIGGDAKYDPTKGFSWMWEYEFSCSCSL